MSITPRTVNPGCNRFGRELPGNPDRRPKLAGWRQHCQTLGMARPLRLHIPNAFYHVMSRGNAKQTIFVEEPDYERFLDLLDATSSRFGVLCRAYCLMPNHFHLLLQP